MRDAFSGYHPVVNFVYFVLVLGFAMTVTHPAYLLVSLLGALGYRVVLRGWGGLLRSLAYMLPAILLTACLNPLFNHQGATILTYLWRGNPLTLESILYGVVAGTMFVTVICWFASVNQVMTGDKFLYLFGRVIPGLSLVLSMALRFVPAFRAKLREASAAQRAMGRGAGGRVAVRLRHGMRLLSIMITWALENAIDTADSMASRGYGLPGRTAYSIYRFDRRDALALGAVAALGGAVLLAYLTGVIRYWYFPTVYVGAFGPPETVSLLAYTLLCAMPVILQGRERRKWRCLTSKT